MRRRRTPEPTAYRTVNLLGIGLALYGLAQPVVLPLLHRVLPEGWLVCASVRLFGRPCPLCGLTRGAGALLRGNWQAAQAYNALTLPLLVLLVLEVAVRGVFLLVERRRPLPPDVMRADLTLHGLLAGLYLAYAAGFVLGAS
jgi:hypothetical protein